MLLPIISLIKRLSSIRFPLNFQRSYACQLADVCIDQVMFENRGILLQEKKDRYLLDMR